MANLHVLTVSGPEFNVVAHIPIPATNNSAGLSWRTALLRSGVSKGVSVLPDGDGTLGTIDATEKANIASGAVYEVVTPIKPSSASADTATINDTTYMAAQYTIIKNQTLSDLQIALKWFGKTGG